MGKRCAVRVVDRPTAVGLWLAVVTQASADGYESTASDSAFVRLQTGLPHPSRHSAASGSGLPQRSTLSDMELAGEARARSARRDSSASPAVLTHDISQAMVQLFEWSWADVAKECETFLGPKGYTAAVISPPSEHITGDSWWTRYQPVSYQLISRSGNEAQFVDMIRRCRAVGVGIYADVVINHCAAMGGVGIGGSTFGYRTYPMFGPEDFHHFPGNPASNCRVDNYKDKNNVQKCDLVGMPDLCTNCSRVQEVAAGYVNRMAQLGIAGIRVDAAKHMDPGELHQLLSKTNSSLYYFQEVIASYGEAVQANSYTAHGPVTEFGFAAMLAPKFMGKDLLRDDLAKFGQSWGLAPSDRAVVFIDNHDTQRSGAAPLTHKSGKLYDLVNVFMLAYPYGYPEVMSSYDFNTYDQGPPRVPVHGNGSTLRCGEGQPWVCEHRRPAIANMVAFRRAAGDGALRDWVASGSTMSFCRGRAGCVAFNLREQPWNARLSVSLPTGDYCDVIRSDEPQTCPKIHVDALGIAVVQVPPKGAVAFHVAALSKIDKGLEESMPLNTSGGSSPVSRASPARYVGHVAYLLLLHTDMFTRAIALTV